MAFSHILGQEHAVGLFRTALEKNELAHAYLLAGPDGVGKRTLVLEIMKTLNCKGSSKESSWPCDQCRECQLIETNQYPDVRLLSFQGQAIKIEVIRQIQQQVSLKPFESRWRLFLLEEIELLTTDASHAFLKILEEPPAGVIFFLTTAHRERVFGTIQSRCQMVCLKNLSYQAIQKRIELDMGAMTLETQAIAQLSAGSLGQAGYWIQPEVRGRRKQILDLLAGRGGSFKSPENSDKEILRQDLFLIQTWLRDLLVWKRTAERSYLIHLDYQKVIQERVSSISDEILQRGIYQIEALNQALERHGNMRLIQQAIERQVTRVLEGGALS